MVSSFSKWIKMQLIYFAFYKVWGITFILHWVQVEKYLMPVSSCRLWTWNVTNKFFLIITFETGWSIKMFFACECFFFFSSYCLRANKVQAEKFCLLRQWNLASLKENTSGRVDVAPYKSDCGIQELCNDSFGAGSPEVTYGQLEPFKVWLCLDTLRFVYFCFLTHACLPSNAANSGIHTMKTEHNKGFDKITHL